MLAGLAVAQNAFAADSCVYSGITHTLTVTSTEGADLTIQTVPNALDPSQAPAISVTRDRTGTALPCGDPTASQVDTIAYVHADGISDFTIVEPRLFAPGFSPEGAGTPEIEFTASEPGGIFSELVVRDGDGVGDTYAIGKGGINVNTDDPVEDVDIALVNTFFTDFAVEGGAGVDQFSAQGGQGTGAAATRGLRLDGGAGVDTLTGGAGDDQFDGGPGDDLIDGGAGSDDVDYGDSTRGVAVDLATTGPQDGGSLGRDTLTGIEGVEGSEFADVLRGTAAANDLFGESGDDLIEGRAGDDFLSGDDGVDTVSYESAGAPVAVDLAVTTPQNTGGAGVDRFFDSFENIIGGPGADVLRGTTGDNVMTGGPGGDTLLALAGNDSLRVRDGIPDTADCGPGTDQALVDDGGIDALVACESVTTVAPAPPAPIATPVAAARAGGTAVIPSIATPILRKAILRGATTQKLVNGGVAVTVACPSLACAARATGATRLKVGTKLRTRALIPARATIAAGRSKVLRVRLRAGDLVRVRAALAARRHPAVRVTVAITEASGARRTLGRTITLRR